MRIKHHSRRKRSTFLLFPEITDPVERERLVRELFEEMLATMVEVGVAPQIIYAARKTEHVVTEENVKFLSRADLEEWEAAIDEYFAINGREG